MIYKNHRVSIAVNNEILDLENDKSLNLRINNVVFDPTKISSTQAEYSFTFNVPITPKNTRIFDWANVLSKKNKFSKLYNAKVYADGSEIFTGQLKISSIDQSNFKCNLVSVKISQLSDIFGDTKMNEMSWPVEYDGTMTTINTVNADMTTDYYFPLACYGVFQKLPKATYDNEYNAYTSKYMLDKYVQWYPESFSPSVKINELVKRMFASKGYTVNGNIFEDDVANSIYLSTHLADGQIPTYNLGRMGSIEVNFKMWTGARWNQPNSSGSSNHSSLGYNLKFPHQYAGYNSGDKVYNFDQIRIYDVLSIADKFKGESPDPRPAFKLLYGTTFSQNNDSMYENGYVIIPADGAYKIEMEVELDISDNEAQEHALVWENGQQVEKTVSHNWDGMPLEIQLIRNQADTELIYGFDGTTYTVYPHEPPNTADTESTGVNGGSFSGATVRPGRDGNRNGNSGSHRTSGSRAVEPSEQEAPDADDFNMGFMPKQGFMLCYDPYANSNFICGGSTIGNCPAVIKNGYSWTSDVLEEYHSRYNCGGYYGVNYKDGTYDWKSTTYNANNYNGAPIDFVSDSGAFKKKIKVSCVVWLKRNDALSLKLIRKEYTGGTYIDDLWKQERQYYVGYRATAEGTLKVSAYSPSLGDLMSNSLTYTSTPKFDYDLNLAQFFNKDVKMIDFINNYMKAFNLTATVSNGSVTFMKNYVDFDKPLVPINFDDRVYYKNLTIQPIDYPSSMEIKYNINEEEAGFVSSVPYPEINYDNWKDYADRGSEKIELTQNEDASSTEETLTNSYTWYSDFKVRQYGENDTYTESTISLPIIIQDEWMIENYKYEESMSKDGKGLPQRWWFRQSPNTNITFTTTNGQDFNPSIPVNTQNGFTLNYKNEQGTLLTDYFNISAYTSSDMIEFECYLKPDEYVLLKKGAPVRINSDIYYICSLTGYDPTGNNTTKVKAMKKG